MFNHRQAIHLFIERTDPMSKVRRDVERLLRETGLSWEIRHGSKHDLVVLDGRTVGIISHGRSESKGHDSNKIAAAIRQFVKRSKIA